jgi:KDO2-lipid IV(A) lauroyltransferase
MQLSVYLLAYPFIWFMSLLPFRVLYILSDVTYVIVYYIIGYRKKTVRENFDLCLPQLSAKEKRVAEKKFYRHFCDSFVEMVKSLHMTDAQMKARFVFPNFEVAHALEDTGKSTVVLIGHYASYEWLLVMHKHFKKQRGLGIYKPIKNKYFDALARRLRARFGSELIGMRDVIPTMRKYVRAGDHGFYGFITDQSPKIQTAVHWGKFFGMEVPIHVGGEMLAKKIGLNIVYAKVEKAAITAARSFRLRAILTMCLILRLLTVLCTCLKNRLKRCRNTTCGPTSDLSTAVTTLLQRKPAFYINSIIGG